MTQQTDESSTAEGQSARPALLDAREPAPPNSLPTWEECAVRVDNSDFIAKRVAEGGYGFDADGKLATQLHRFIYEYDDADPYRSAWFLHRLELVLEEAKREASNAALTGAATGTEKSPDANPRPV